MISIAIAILNWNGEELLRRFLKVLEDNSKEASIYVIDNASTDGSIVYIENNHPNVNLIKLDNNYGYAGGYNRGLVSVKEELICLLNNDVLVKSEWLTPKIQKLFPDNRDNPSDL